jgi:hypothetical protein
LTQLSHTAAMLTVNVLLLVAAAAVVKAQGMGPGKGEF